ncbi:MAG: biotin synthase BioB, partial [Candidatus Aureabacteria bacterium]|nr:biotin synthase BioB [Candidatus Auribacterota bacterium]
MNNQSLARAARVISGGGIRRDDAIGLVTAPLGDLLDGAERIREHVFGREISFCAIINARSGLCGEDCAFCAQS